MSPTDETPLNLTRYCLEQWALDPETVDRPAFTFVETGADDRTWTFGQCWDRVQSIARGLAGAGLQPGDRVLIRLPHSPEYAFVFFGASLAGLAPVPASPQLTVKEATFLLRDSGAVAIIRDQAGALPGFIGLEILAGDLANLDGPAPLPTTTADQPAFLIYTSGTTSHPKGVLHAHRTVWGRTMMREGWQGFESSDTTLHAGTLNWSYTLGVGLMDAWSAGAHAVLRGGQTDPAVWPELIERLGVTIFIAVPTVYRQLLKYGRPEDHDLSRLRHVLCAGEALMPALYREWRERVGTDMYESLGMTEISTYISSGPATPTRIGSPGRPQPGRWVAILPEEGSDTEPLQAGEVGMLAVHRSDPGLMLGYWNRPEEEEVVFRGEWFLGGDRASQDADGYIWFQGRADDVIKSFGYRLSPVEIEAALESHPLVSEAAVVGHALDETKTLVSACIVATAAGVVDEEVLRSYAAEHLAGYKQPHQYHFVDQLPRTRNGKLQRSALLARLQED